MVPILQKEIDLFKDVVWNNHRIRFQNDTYLPDGVPNHIYDFPQEYGLEDCGEQWWNQGGATGKSAPPHFPK